MPYIKTSSVVILTTFLPINDKHTINIISKLLTARKTPKSVENTAESLEKLRIAGINADSQMQAKISRLKNRDSFVRFLRTGEDCVPNKEEITDVSIHNIPAYELLSSDESN